MVKPKLNINNEEDLEQIKEKLKNFVKVEERHVDIIPPAVYIRFINRETGELKAGGIVSKNYKKGEKLYNYILLLICPESSKRLYVKVTKSKHVFFIRDDVDKKIEQAEKDNLYILYKQGLVKIVEDDESVPDDYCDELYE